MQQSDEKKIYREPVIYMTKYEDLEAEKLLAIVVSHIESYVRQNQTMPEKIRFSYNNYEKILKHNKSLIMQKDNKYYTFGVEIEIEARNERKVRGFTYTKRHVFGR